MNVEDDLRARLRATSDACNEAHNELYHLRSAWLRRHSGLKRTVARAIGTFEHDPDFQIRFHKVAMLFWVFAAIAGTTWCVCFPGSWLSDGVLLVFLISIYSNWDTDYDAVSAASAFKHAQAADTKIETDK